MPDLSIVTISTNQLGFIKRNLEALFANQGRVSIDVLLIDNACTDGTGAWVREHYPQVRVHRNDTRLGYTTNGNMGIRMVTPGRYYVMLNPDIECLPGMLEGLVAFMDANPDVGVCGPQLLNPDRTVQPSCRAFSTPLGLLLRGLHLDKPLGWTPVIRRYLMTDMDHSQVADVDWLTGALLVLRPEALQQVGLMDERYFIYSDDQDWCARMWHAGWRVTYVPIAVAVHHHVREGIKKPWSPAARWQLASAIRMFRKFGWRLSRTPPARPDGASAMTLTSPGQRA